MIDNYCVLSDFIGFYREISRLRYSEKNSSGEAPEVDSDVVKHNLTMSSSSLLPELPELPDPVPRFVSSES